MVSRRNGEVRTTNGPTSKSNAIKRLWARHLVHKVEIDVEQVGFALGAVHKVGFPHLLRHCPGAHARTSTMTIVSSPPGAT